MATKVVGNKSCQDELKTAQGQSHGVKVKDSFSA